MRDVERRRPGRVNDDARAPAGDAIPGKATLVRSATTPLPAALRARLEHALSTDLSAVRVGTDPRVAAMGARAVGAGTQIVFAPGAYDPESPAGAQLVAHEVVHLTQQVDRGIAATRVAGPLAINDEVHHEREADDLAERALRGEVVRAGGPAPRDGAAPLQGFFDDFGKLGELIDGAVTTVAHAAKKVSHAVSTALDPVLPEDHAGSFELQRVLELDDVGVIGAAYDALVAARAARAPGQTVDAVAFSGADTTYDLAVAPTVTDAMIPAFHTRRDQLAFLPVDDAWTAFEAGFNREFRSLLHAFDLSPVRDDLSVRAVNVARLQYLFTATQRDQLADYIATQQIPERLFDGDEVGHATAHQRILLASQILADGTYRPGAWSQEVHARACYHWAEAVYQYAGAATRTETTRGGITGQFDLFGGALLSADRKHELFHARRDDALDPTPEHLARNPKAYRYGNAPWDTVRQLVPGDWIYIYNSNESGSGAHSVVFDGWAGPEGFDAVAGKPYRAARVFGQHMPVTGGGRDLVILGSDEFAVQTGGVAHPVNEIFRADPDAEPIHSAQELTPAAADSAVTPNERFEQRKERKYKRAFVRAKFLAWIRTANDWFLAELDSEARLTDGQRRILQEANASDDVRDVICLHQRLYTLHHNSEALADNVARDYGIAATAERWADEAASSVEAAALRARIAMHEAERAGLTATMAPLSARREELEHDDATKAAYAELARIRKEIKKLPRGPARTRKVREAVAQKDKWQALDADGKHHKPEIRAIEAELAPYERRDRELERAIDELEDELHALAPSTVYGLVNGTSSKGQLKGQAHVPPINGRYEDIPGEPPWADFMGDPL